MIYKVRERLGTFNTVWTFVVDFTFEAEAKACIRFKSLKIEAQV